MHLLDKKIIFLCSTIFFLCSFASVPEHGSLKMLQQSAAKKHALVLQQLRHENSGEIKKQEELTLAGATVRSREYSVATLLTCAQQNMHEKRAPCTHSLDKDQKVQREWHCVEIVKKRYFNSSVAIFPGILAFNDGGDQSTFINLEEPEGVKKYMGDKALKCRYIDESQREQYLVWNDREKKELEERHLGKSYICNRSFQVALLENGDIPIATPQPGEFIVVDCATGIEKKRFKDTQAKKEIRRIVVDSAQNIITVEEDSEIVEGDLKRFSWVAVWNDGKIDFKCKVPQMLPALTALAQRKCAAFESSKRRSIKLYDATFTCEREIVVPSNSFKHDDDALWCMSRLPNTDFAVGGELPFVLIYTMNGQCKTRLGNRYNHVFGLITLSGGRLGALAEANTFIDCLGRLAIWSNEKCTECRNSRLVTAKQGYRPRHLHKPMQVKEIKSNDTKETQEVVVHSIAQPLTVEKPAPVNPPDRCCIIS